MAATEIVKTLAPSFVREYFRNIHGRLAALESTVQRIDALQATIIMLEATVDEVIEHPRYSRGDDIGFNGQLRRKEIFADLLSAIPFSVLVETGTWTGDTTGYMAETSRLPVFTGELSYRFHRLAALRLVDVPGIDLRHADSRRFLSDLAAEPGLTSKSTFFYLDAHWHSDLPLATEIEVIADSWNDFVIMIDDFQVPGDAGYGFDDYGAGKSLTIEYLAPALSGKDLVAYYPSARSEEETGHQRGCVVLSRRGTRSATLDRVGSLRPA